MDRGLVVELSDGCLSCRSLIMWKLLAIFFIFCIKVDMGLRIELERATKPWSASGKFGVQWASGLKFFILANILIIIN